MPPPMHEAAHAPHGPESSDWLGTPKSDQEVVYDAREMIRTIFPLTHRDPTGRQALSAVQKRIGWFEPDAEVLILIRSKSRGRIDIRLDFEMKSMHMELLNRAGEITPTQSGHGYRARTKKNTPAASKFGDKNAAGVTPKTDH